MTESLPSVIPMKMAIFMVLLFGVIAVDAAQPENRVRLLKPTSRSVVALPSARKEAGYSQTGYASSVPCGRIDHSDEDGESALMVTMSALRESSRDSLGAVAETPLSAADTPRNGELLRRLSIEGMSWGGSVTPRAESGSQGRMSLDSSESAREDFSLKSPSPLPSRGFQRVTPLTELPEYDEAPSALKKNSSDAKAILGVYAASNDRNRVDSADACIVDQHATRLVEIFFEKYVQPCLKNGDIGKPLRQSGSIEDGVRTLEAFYNNAYQHIGIPPSQRERLEALGLSIDRSGMLDKGARAAIRRRLGFKDYSFFLQ